MQQQGQNWQLCPQDVAAVTGKPEFLPIPPIVPIVLFYLPPYLEPHLPYAQVLF